MAKFCGVANDQSKSFDYYDLIKECLRSNPDADLPGLRQAIIEAMTSFDQS